MTTMTKKRGLGRGLASLLGDLASPAPAANPAMPATGASVSVSIDIHMLPVDLLQRGQYQPRKHMDNEALQELADSIKTSGMIQPIIARKINASHFEIVAGERRWRAAQLAGLHAVPVIVKEINNAEAGAWSLIENIQREALNALEEAEAFDRLIREFRLTHEEIAKSVGKSRATITNVLRILNLNPDVQKFLAQNQIELGHAKALLALTGVAQSQAAAKVVRQKLSVRETERFVRDIISPISSSRSSLTIASSPDIRHLEQRLSEKLGAKVHFSHLASGKGKILIHYNTLDELQGILSHFD